MRSEGLAGLWRGNGLSIIRAMLSKGILFSSQDAFASKLSQTRTEPEPEPSPSPSPSHDANASPIRALTLALSLSPTLTHTLTTTLARQARLRYVGWRRCGALGGRADLPARLAAHSASGDGGRRDVGESAGARGSAHRRPARALPRRARHHRRLRLGLTTLALALALPLPLTLTLTLTLTLPLPLTLTGTR